MVREGRERRGAELITCPLCQGQYSISKIAEHADQCATKMRNKATRQADLRLRKDVSKTCTASDPSTNSSSAAIGLSPAYSDSSSSAHVPALGRATSRGVGRPKPAGRGGGLPASKKQKFGGNARSIASPSYLGKPRKFKGRHRIPAPDVDHIDDFPIFSQYCTHTMLDMVSLANQRAQNSVRYVLASVYKEPTHNPPAASPVASPKRPSGLAMADSSAKNPSVSGKTSNVSRQKPVYRKSPPLPRSSRSSLPDSVKERASRSTSDFLSPAAITETEMLKQVEQDVLLAKELEAQERRLERKRKKSVAKKMQASGPSQSSTPPVAATLLKKNAVTSAAPVQVPFDISATPTFSSAATGMTSSTADGSSSSNIGLSRSPTTPKKNEIPGNTSQMQAFLDVLDSRPKKREKIFVLLQDYKSDNDLNGLVEKVSLLFKDEPQTLMDRFLELIPLQHKLSEENQANDAENAIDLTDDGPESEDAMELPPFNQASTSPPFEALKDSLYLISDRQRIVLLPPQ